MNLSKLSVATLTLAALLVSGGQALAATTTEHQTNGGAVLLGEYKTQRECVNEALFIPKSVCKPSGRGTYYLLLPTTEA